MIILKQAKGDKHSLDFGLNNILLDGTSDYNIMDWKLHDGLIYHNGGNATNLCEGKAMAFKMICNNAIVTSSY